MFFFFKQIFNKFNLFIFSGLFLFQLACKNDKCLQSSGEIINETRHLEAFKTIDVYNYFNVYLKSDTINKIEIEAGGKLIPNIETSVTNGNLTIRDLNTCGFLKGYADKNLYISVDTLSLVTVYDASRLYTQDTLKVKELRILFLSQVGTCDMIIHASTFNLDIWYGDGDYIVRGKAESASFYARVLSFIYANELEANSCYVYNQSMGDCYVKANESLTLEIHDSGNVYYSGEPSVIEITNNSGTGKLIKK